MEWNSASEEYASIGKVEYRFALLNEARKNVPEPPAPQEYRTDNTSYLETSIASNYFNTYMVVMNVPERSKWLPGLQRVEQDVPQAFVGSIHRLIFDSYEAIVSPLRMTATDEGIVYAESCVIKAMDISLVYEFVFRKIDEKNCGLACRFMNAGEYPLPKESNIFLFERMQQMTNGLKVYCEKMRES